MKFGKNTALVEEVIDFVKGGYLLNASGCPPTGVSIIRDYNEAKIRAWEKTYGEDEFLWTDIREKEMSQVKGKTYSLDDFSEIRQELSKNMKLFTIYLRRRLEDEYQELLDDMIGDLHNCAFNRAVNGNESNFFERLFQIYKSGGWPCGYEIDEKGNLLSFYPPSK